MPLRLRAMHQALQGAAPDAGRLNRHDLRNAMRGRAVADSLQIRHAVVIVDPAAVLVGIGGHRAAFIARRAFELVAGQRDHVAGALHIVFERFPGQRVAVGADAQEAAEFHDGVADLARDLVDHQRVDRAQLVAGRVVDVGAVDLVRGNDAGCGVGGDHGFLHWDSGACAPARCAACGGWAPGVGGATVASSGECEAECFCCQLRGAVAGPG